ncbi:hypothetical protein [Novosphingobium mangrovi (ex Huang et al. 2023)]|uniref:Uncharacterized protein n=1 Tax=Novosphingobium mangrovi (ex Huang et al. 2023) TaxID=2976432 RepID=A0ABT2I1C2_9SPHN|nr:hypothetical protein [Novosphingobium mangrovi (ex Huang et al. 2023)]MCT2398600.1 hypothetical protein [Novosphingobium mangrovi (ex Huang et al. 2023)]
MPPEPGRRWLRTQAATNRARACRVVVVVVVVVRCCVMTGDIAMPARKVIRQACEARESRHEVDLPGFLAGRGGTRRRVNPACRSVDATGTGKKDPLLPLGFRIADVLDMMIEEIFPRDE